MEQERILQLKNINYSYGSNPALCGFDFDLYAREIHALTGDHRSGKSTLAKILGGSLRNQGGSMNLNGRYIQSFTPKTALDNGIGVVYQTPEIIPNMTAVENIYAGRMPHFLIRKGDKKKMRRDCEALFGDFGIEIDLDTPLHKLSQGNQQIISIAKVLSLGIDILVLDEISQRLTPTEMKNIYRTCRKIKEKGKSIIYLTSNIDEIFRIADRVTVIRDGYRKGTEKVPAIDPSKLVNLAYNMAYSSDGDDGEDNPRLLFTKHEEAVIRDLPLGMIILDSGGGIRFMNTSAETHLGVLEGERGDISLETCFARIKLEDYRQVLDDIGNRENRIREKLLTNDNRRLRLKSLPIYDQEGAFLGTNIFIEDVSAEYDTNEYLLRAEKNASTAELAAGVAHEVNNPLGIIKNYVELIDLSAEDPEIQESVGHIRRELDRIVEIIGSLISFSRVQQNPFRGISVIDLVDEVLLLLGHRLREKNITLERDYHGQPVIMGLENKLKQLFINLVLNSLDAVLTGGKITVRIEEFPGEAEISFGDNGYGIPQDIQADVFKPFFSTKMTRTNTGLGLSICQHIVESHKGIITFESSPGQWTWFRVRIPTDRQDREAYGKDEHRET